MLYSSPSCYPNENEEQHSPQDPSQEDATTSPPLVLLIAAADRLSSRRSSQQRQQEAPPSLFSHPAVVSARLPTATFDLEEDWTMPNSNTSSGTTTGDVLSTSSSPCENEKPSVTTATDHRADMSNVVRIIDEALEILKKGDEYSLDDDIFDLSKPFDPLSFSI